MAKNLTTARPPIGFSRVLLTIVHLAALGVLGWAVISLIVSLVVTAIGLVFALGIGLVFLVGVIYLLFGVGWFEVERVRSLYSLGASSLSFRRRETPGFGGWLRALMRQSVDIDMWRALASFGLATLFGVVVLWLVTGVSRWLFGTALGGAGVLSPLNRIDGPNLTWLNHPVWALLAAGLVIAAVVGLAWWHAFISRALIDSPTRRALTDEVRTKSAQREGAVRAAEVERTRIERDLHDGVQPRLVSIGMTLGLAQKKIHEDPQAATALIEEAHTSTKSAITELRQLARGIHVSVLDDRGLDAALSALAGRSHIPVNLDVRMEGRPSESTGSFRDAEAAVYFSIAESLTNAAKHSRAAECRVTVRLRDAGTPHARLWARIEDNGVGGATVQPGGGLDGISNRVLAAGGSFNLDSPFGGPTSVEVNVPCAF